MKKETETIEESEITKNFGKEYIQAFNKKDIVERVLEIQPCHYDKARIWWLWNWQFHKWERVDDVEILNAISRQAEINTINAKERNEILEAIKQVSRLPGYTPEPIGANWVQFNKTLVNIKTGEQERATPHLFVTNPIPWELSEEGFTQTPIIDKIFESWVGKDYVLTLHQIVAYCMINHYPIHRIFCFVGAGMNGKSKFLELLRRLIGEFNCCSTELDVLMQSRFEVSRLHKKLVCQMGETNFNEMTKTSVLKKLSGGDLIGFEYKNKDLFDDVNYAKIIISTNNLPATSDKSVGFYRRWLIIDFPNSFGEKKDILEDIPKEEYSAWALKLTFILKDLLEKRTFHNEGDIEDRMRKFEERSNPFEKFWKEYIVENVNGYISKRQFYDKLSAWLKENRFRSMSDVTIAKRMREKGIEAGRKQMTWESPNMETGEYKRFMVWLDISWRDNNDNS